MPKRKGGRRKVAENIHKTEAGTYEVKVSVKGRQIKRTAKTYQKALELRRKLDLQRSIEEAARDLDAPPARLTLGQYLNEIWLPNNFGTGRLAIGTERHYRCSLKLLTRPAPNLPGGLQAVELEAIGRREITAFVRMLSEGRKQSTVGQHLKVAMAVIRAAKDDGLLGSIPSGSGLLRKPHRSVRESWVWRKEEVREALAYVGRVSDKRGLWQGHPVLVALLLFATTGARKCEIFGLRWKDIELPETNQARRVASMRRMRKGTAAISISRQAMWNKTSWRLERLKSTAARRRIEIVHPTLVEALKRHKALSPKSRLDLVLTNFALRSGPRPYGQSTCPITRRIKLAAAELGIRKDPETEAEMAAGAGRPKTLHGLRHYFASQLIELGEDPVYVSRLLGHSTPAITYSIYGWALKTSRPESSLELQEGLLEGLDILKPAAGEE